ncbi:MAG: ATP-dependent helicase [Candidatus Binatia bacterium]
MPITQVQMQIAQAMQHAAAHDAAAQVRMVAGPGTGKSSSIEERVLWLLAGRASADEICVVSFTRASALDLRQRIQTYCTQNGQATATQVRVSTLHSLALRTLRAAGLLTAYPTEPLVLDSWELKSIFDAEFGNFQGIGRTRCEEIRLEHEAFWSTGQWAPANYITPNPPISPAERNQFQAFHGPRAQLYSCVLPGEIVRQCVGHIRAGTLDPVALLNLRQLIVDEYQDLNPVDLEFIDSIAARGAVLFVAGDDDQSIYSFRYASPGGIQSFSTRYPQSAQHSLSECFRCTPSVLAAGQSVIGANPGPNRIPKNHVSLYAASSPAVQGVVHRWQFQSGIAEARALAESCRDLISSGINPRDILILLSNQRVLGPILASEFETATVPFEPPHVEGFLDSEVGRLVLALARIACNSDDYTAHRVILGLLSGVGVGTCNAISQAVIANNLNYRDIFYRPLPATVFSARAVKALNQMQTICRQVSSWQATDQLAQRISDIAAILSNVLGPAETQAWQNYVTALPSGTTLEELRDFLWADTDEQQAALLHSVYTRLNHAVPPGGLLPARVRVMTMHGAKGLSARVVLVPGIEEEILPGPWRRPYPGLVLEAARLLYVSVTRARAALVLSYSATRIVDGRFKRRAPSRFCTQLGGGFGSRSAGLTAPEISSIMQDCSML